MALGDLPTSCTALTRSSGRYVFEQAPAGLVLSALRVRRGSGQGGCRCSGGFSRLRRRTRPRSWLRCKSRLRPPPPLKVRQKLESTSIPRSDPSEIQVDLGERVLALHLKLRYPAHCPQRTMKFWAPSCREYIACTRGCGSPSQRSPPIPAASWCALGRRASPSTSPAGYRPH